MHTCSADVIIGTETWLSSDVADSELALHPSFKIFRKDRENSRGGGVIIAIRGDYNPSLLIVDTPLELVAITARIGHAQCVIVACYRPPDNRSDFVHLFNTAIEHIFSQYPKCILIVGGDFNYPYIDWSNSSLKENSNRSECVNFLHTLHFHHLSQVVQKPTRGNHILDLILTNHPEFSEVRVLDPISDHNVVHCSFALKSTVQKKMKKCILSYARANTEKMMAILAPFAADFSNEFQNRSANDNWCLFRDRLKEVEANCIPKITITSRPNDPWFNHDVKKCINKKKRAFRKFSRTKTQADWENYKNISRLTETAIANAKNEFFNSILPNMLKTDPKKFWQVVNPKHNHAAPLLTENGVTLSIIDSANKFRKCFSDVFTREHALHDAHISHQPLIQYPFLPIVISQNGISRAIDRLPNKTSPGPDGISAKLLKFTSHYSSLLLSLIFQQSLDTGCVPEDWKSALVIPVFKSGDSTDPTNYRPISLTCISCKLLEHVLYTHIITYLNQNNLLLDNQHGFRQHRSCQTQLFELVTDIHTSIHNQLYIDAIFIDFSKAFDRVPHNRLKLKIRNLQLDYNCTRWIEEFLSNRFQVISLQDCFSTRADVISGVPQGSVLGPLLFLIYINDIAVNLASQIRLFADDCVIYKPITSNSDVISLQLDLNRLTEWCNTWQMEINISKTKHVQFASTIRQNANQYKIRGANIGSVSSIKYLGVLFTSNLNWNAHIEHVTSKACKKLGYLKRRLHVANTDTRLRAYISLIRPSLEYASIIWHPHHAYLSNLLESVQNKAARFIMSSYSHYVSVSALKKRLNLVSLGSRRKFARLVFFHNLHHGNSTFARANLLPAPNVSTRRDHVHKIKPIFARTNLYQNSPLVLSITEWNSLPSSLVSLTESTLFQAALTVFFDGNPP